jgi:tetratricopeptide (TPR) repeat protein
VRCFIRYTRPKGIGSGICLVLLCVIGALELRAQLPSENRDAEEAKWRKVCAGIDPVRDPVGWSFAAENLASSLRYDDIAEAVAIQRQVIKKRTLLYGAEHLKTLNAFAGLAKYLEEQDVVQAEHVYRVAIAGFEKNLGIGGDATRHVMHNLVALLLKVQDYAAAEVVLRRLLAVEGDKTDPRARLDTSQELADVLRAQGKYAAAEPYFRSYLKARKLEGRPETMGFARSIYHFSLVCEKLNRREEALVLAREAVDHAHKSVGNDNDDLPTLEKHLAALEAGAK